MDELIHTLAAALIIVGLVIILGGTRLFTGPPTPPEPMSQHSSHVQHDGRR